MTTWTQVGQHMQCRIQRDIMTRFHFHSKFEIVIWLIFCIFYRYRLITSNDVIGCLMIRKKKDHVFYGSKLILAHDGISRNSKFEIQVYMCPLVSCLFVSCSRRKPSLYDGLCSFLLCVRLLRALLFLVGFCVDPWGFLFTLPLVFSVKRRCSQYFSFIKQLGCHSLFSESVDR